MAAVPVLFLDIKASAVDGWPVEIAWAAADLQAGESWLVRPVAEWDDLPWSAEAEALHGLTPERLEADGTDPRRIAARLSEDLAGCRVVCEAPEAVRGWLQALFDQSPLPQPPHVTGSASLRPPPLPADDPALMRLRARAGLTPGQALDDAVALALAWAVAKGTEDAEDLAADARDLVDFAGRPDGD